MTGNHVTDPFRGWDMSVCHTYYFFPLLGLRAVGVDANFGPIGVAVVVVLVAFGLVSTWVARHPLEWHRLPLIRTVLGYLPKRVDVAAARLRARLGISGAAMAAGVAGLLAVGALAVGFTALLDDVLEGEGIAQFDNSIAQWLAAHREVWLTKALLGVTRLGNADAQTVWLVLVCIVAAVSARSWVPVVVGVAGGGGIAMVIVIAKTLVGRPRPALPYAVIPVDGFSFPSGHATGAAAVGTIGAWTLCRWVVRQWAAQVAVWAAAITAVGLIGLSRCYLGVHFVTDVLAGWLLGAGWAGSVILLASWWSRATSTSVGGRNSGSV